MPGTLSIVATPIGNLEDITRRAERILAEADLVVCEDTRVSSKLFAHLKLKKKTLSIHEHSVERQIEGIIAELLKGKNIAYVSDAGTPGVNDPGGKLVAAAFEQGIPVSPIPGPSALTAAISICGFPMDDFAYLGFAPHKKGRETFFKNIANKKEASIFFESTHRIEKTLIALQATLDPKRLICVGRELTKLHESIYRGPSEEVAKHLHATSLKGEFVIVVAPSTFT